MHPSPPHDEHALDAPDYLALVIEWNDEDNVRTLVRTPPARPLIGRTLATALGALGAIALTTLGLRLLRHA